MADQDRARSGTNIVQSRLELKDWIARVPTVDEARPGQCPACQRPSRPVGGSLGLWGHGLRQRQQRGPLVPLGPPRSVVVSLRRFLCRHCGAVTQVVPRGVLLHKHFAAAAIALAMCLHGVVGLSSTEVRRRVSPWAVVGVGVAGEGWPSLGRWLDDQQQGRLFAAVRKVPADFTSRQQAERIATTALSFAPPDLGNLGPIERAYFGGAHLA